MKKQGLRSTEHEARARDRVKNISKLLYSFSPYIHPRIGPMELPAISIGCRLSRGSMEKRIYICSVKCETMNWTLMCVNYQFYSIWHNKFWYCSRIPRFRPKYSVFLRNRSDSESDLGLHCSALVSKILILLSNVLRRPGLRNYVQLGEEFMRCICYARLRENSSHYLSYAPSMIRRLYSAACVMHSYEILIRRNTVVVSPQLEHCHANEVDILY